MNDLPAKPAWRWMRTRLRLWMVLGAVIALLLLALFLPSLLSVSRYQRTITTAMARSVGRPVHLSGVEWRLLPTPAFILHDLTVSEDASFGAEPMLTARTVVASVNFLSLWRGRPVFSRIQVDQASLNLVRNAAGRWNLEALLSGQAQHLAGSKPGGRSHALPYLEATESRLNLKSGYEKSPYSLVNADLSFWQDQPGKWRIRLRGEPVRTDIAQSGDRTQDAGEIRLEGSVQSAATLRQMPVHLQLAWRNAQLGQLSLLLLGDDAGWRGNLTADVDVLGNAESAAIQGRLRATGVHRVEFAPAVPLDFDSNCGLTYLHSTRAVHQLHCDTSIGDGHLLYAAEMPASTEHTARQQTITLQKLPAQAVLDLIRTMRSDFAPGITAAGTLNGQLRFAPALPASAHPARTHTASHIPRSFGEREPHEATSVTTSVDPSIWTGSLSLTDAVLRGSGFPQPWLLPRIQVTPDASGTLTARVPVPVCASVKTTSGDLHSGTPASSAAADCFAALDLTPAGYSVQITGLASLPRLRSWATALGAGSVFPVGFDQGTAEMHLQAAGPWIHSAALTDAAALPLTGSLHLHNARWTQAPLSLPVLIPDATLSLNPTSVALRGTVSNGSLRATIDYLQPIDGTASVPSIALHFDHLDAAAVEHTLAPTNDNTGLFAAIASRVHPEAASIWPPMRLTIQANTFTLDRLTLTHLTAEAHRGPDDPAHQMKLDSLDASLFGGHLMATGTVETMDRDDGGQRYQIHLNARDLQCAPLAALMDAGLTGSGWTGGHISGIADVTTQGNTETQWINSATGSLHFDWTRGNLGNSTSTVAKAASGAISEAISGAFDHWTGQATLRAGLLTLDANTFTRHGHTEALTGTLTTGGAVQLSRSARKP